MTKPEKHAFCERERARICTLAGWLAVAALAWAEDHPSTRAAAIAAERDAKAAALRPEKPPQAERVYLRIRSNPAVKQLLATPRGFHLSWGGLISDSSLSLGPAYSRTDLRHETVHLNVSAIGSLRRYYRLAAEIKFPRLLHDRVFFEAEGARFDYPSLAYFGRGLDSKREDRTNYRLECNSLVFRFGVRPEPRRRLRLGVTGAFLEPNVGPGVRQGWLSIEQLFTPAEAPGIDRQGRFLAGGPFLELDLRDVPQDPHAGTWALVRYQYFKDNGFSSYSFKRLTAEARQYLPLLNRKRVFVLRGVTQLSFPGPGQSVPFWLQPWLGDSDALRGFDTFRFRDNNSLLLQGEYRWEVFSALDMALFYDGGKVFRRPGQLALSQLESSAGFGFRFRSREAQAFRVDFGFSRETFRIWLKYGSTFPGRPPGLF